MRSPTGLLTRNGVRAGARPRFRPSWARRLRASHPILHDAVAITPVVGTLVILAISTVGIAAVLTWGLPNIQQTQAVAELDGIYAQFEAFEEVANGVMRGGAIGKASEVSANIPKGQLQRVEDTMLWVAWFHNRTDENDAFFWLDGVADDTPRTFTISKGNTMGVTETLWIEMYRVLGDESIAIHNTAGVLTPSSGFASSDTVTVTLPEATGLYEQPTRIVIGYYGPNSVDITIMEGWLIPLSSLEYIRDTSFGLAGARLQNNAVLSESEQGDFMRTDPLGLRESAADGDPTFAGVFTMQFIDNATYPGVQAAGTGSYPLLFALYSNHDRASGVSVDAFTINVWGPHQKLWLDKYDELYGMWAPTEDPDGDVQVPDGTQKYGIADTSGNGLIVQAPSWKLGNREAFTFVLMESLVELTLKVEVKDLGTGV